MLKKALNIAVVLPLGCENVSSQFTFISLAQKPSRTDMVFWPTLVSTALFYSGIMFKKYYPQESQRQQVICSLLVEITLSTFSNKALVV